MLSPIPVQVQPTSVAEGRRTLIVDLPAEQVLTGTSLIDRIINTVFDDLDHTMVEVRVRDQRVETTPRPAHPVRRGSASGAAGPYQWATFFP